MTKPRMPRQNHEAGGSWCNDTRQSLRGILILSCIILTSCASTKGRPEQANVRTPLQRIGDTEQHLFEPLVNLLNGLFSKAMLVQITPAGIIIGEVDNRPPVPSFTQEK